MVVGLIVAFWAPLRQTAAEVPQIIKRSDEVALMGVSIEVGHQLVQGATPEIVIVLEKVSKQGVKEILRMADSESAVEDVVVQGVQALRDEHQ